MYCTEIVFSKTEVTNDEWQSLILMLAKHAKGIHPFTVYVQFHENLVKYYLLSKHDLSQLSTGIDGAVLRPATNVESTRPKATRLGLLKIPEGGTLFDLRERYKVQENIVLEHIFVDVQRIGFKVFSKAHIYFKAGSAYKVAHRQLSLFPGHLLAFNFAESNNYIQASMPKYVSLEKTLHILNSENINGLFKVPTFPYLNHDYFLNLTSYEFDKHSFIIGSSGSGKSKFISLFIDRLQRSPLKPNYRVVVIDPHAALDADLGSLPDTTVINFSGEGAKLFPEGGSDISAATELTTTLFRSLLSSQFTPRLERVLRFSLYILFTAQNMSFTNLKLFLSDVELRTQILQHVHGYVPPNVELFFGGDFNEIRAKYNNEAIAPILSIIDEMQLQPALVGDAGTSLAKTIEENFITVFSLNKVSMGDEVVKTVAGLLIQQIFLLAQARSFNQRVLLFIDEVSVVQTPALASILAEARKFNLFVILTQQYFGQIEKELRDSILSNVNNYYVFKVSEEDARLLEGNLNIELPKELLAQETAKGLKESDIRVKLMTELHPRECIIRIAANGQILPAIKASTLDAPEVEPAMIAKQAELKAYKQQNIPPKFEVQTNPLPDVQGAPRTIPLVQISNAQIESGNLNQQIKSPLPATQVTSLNQLLAQHSSSRQQVNKEKNHD